MMAPAESVSTQDFTNASIVEPGGTARGVKSSPRRKRESFQLALEEIRAGVFAGVIRRCFFHTYHMTKQTNGGWSLKQGGPFNAPEGSIPALCIEIDDVFPRYEEQHRKRTGQPVPLSLADIRRTLEKEPYWLRPGTDKDPRNHHARASEESRAKFYLRYGR